MLSSAQASECSCSFSKLVLPQGERALDFVLRNKGLIVSVTETLVQQMCGWQSVADCSYTCLAAGQDTAHGHRGQEDIMRFSAVTTKSIRHSRHCVCSCVGACPRLGQPAQNKCCWYSFAPAPLSNRLTHDLLLCQFAFEGLQPTLQVLDACGLLVQYSTQLVYIGIDGAAWLVHLQTGCGGGELVQLSQILPQTCVERNEPVQCCRPRWQWRCFICWSSCRQPV